MKLVAIMLTFGIEGSAHALTPQNLTCEMPGLGLAAFITGFDGRYQVFDWWDKTGDTLGMKAVVYADCKGGQSLRATTDQSSDTLDAATDILWTAGRAGQSGDLAALTAALQDAGFAVDTQPLATDHCACTDEMIGLSGQ